MSGNPAGRAHRRPHSKRDGGRWRKKEQSEDEGKAVDPVPHGTCTTMCPAHEVRQREARNRLHRFEMLPGTERNRVPRADVSRAVKEYSRPAAGKDSTRASDLRLPDVLLKTVCYLVDDIAASATLQPWTEVYSFVFDRLRSVRQDMIIQRVSGPVCVAVLEKTVRFLLYAEYRSCGQPLRCFDPRINETHLQECLSWLLECYREGQQQHQNQEEFQALNLLYNLGSARVIQHTLELPERVRRSVAVRLALEVNCAYAERNPVRLLRLVKRLDFLQVCALHRHLLPCRTHLLLLYSHGHSSRNCRFPIQKLAQLLHLEPAPTAQLCQAHGVQVSEDSVLFFKSSFTETASTELHCSHMHGPVDQKQRDLTVADIIHGLKNVHFEDEKIGH